MLSLSAPSLPAVKTLPPTTAKEARPRPTFSFHKTGGPSAGQSLRHPVSGVVLSRLGPWKFGQSAAGNETQAERARRKSFMRLE